MKQLVLVVDNIRSAHNVGSLFRTCDALGIKHIYLCGITPHLSTGTNDDRLPHQILKIKKDIHKTALGAEDTVPWEYYPTTKQAIYALKAQGYQIVALEQDATSVSLVSFTCSNVAALVVGPEVTGMTTEIVGLCDDIVEIPMHGVKESLNVSVAAGIALYTLTH